MTELEKSARYYSDQVIKTTKGVTVQLENQLSDIRKKQDDLEWKLIQVLEGLAKEHQNLQIISTGLVNSTAVLLKKQQQMFVQTENARRSVRYSVIIAWIIPLIALLGFIAVLFLNQR